MGKITKKGESKAGVKEGGKDRANKINKKERQLKRGNWRERNV